MKTRIHLWLVACTLILGVYACAEPAKTPPPPHVNFVEEIAKPEKPDCDLCDSTGHDTASCAGDRLVKDSCARAWEKAWITSSKSDGVNIGDTTLLLSKTELATLESACPTCSGKRVYFGKVKRKGEKRLALMIVNVKTSNCDDDNAVPKGKSQPVLAVFRNTDGTMKEEFVSLDSAKLWSEHFSAEFYGGDDPKYLKVHSYTFMSSKLKATAGKSKTYLIFRFAMHKAQKACNVPYDFGDKADGKVIDLVVRPDQGNEDGRFEYLDFARPCPNYCNGTSLIH